VTNTADSGPGSLRKAIMDANANPGPDTIVFSVGGGGHQVIQPASPLPALTGVTVVNAMTQPGYGGFPLIELNGSAAGTGANGLTLTAGSSTVKGLLVNGFDQAALLLTGAGGDTVVSNYLGTNVTGTAAVANGYGVHVQAPYSHVGGTGPGDANLISGNLLTGVFIEASGTVVQGNFIGTDASGTAALGNANGVVLEGAGVTNTLIGGPGEQGGNFISGNAANGILIWNGPTATVIQGNHIGADVTGFAPLGNGIGVQIQNASNNLVGGTTDVTLNLISGNVTGLLITGASTGNQVVSNVIGTDGIGEGALGNGYGVIVQSGAWGNTIGGTGPGEGNVIAASSFYGISLNFGASATWSRATSSAPTPAARSSWATAPGCSSAVAARTTPSPTTSSPAANTRACTWPAAAPGATTSRATPSGPTTPGPSPWATVTGSCCPPARGAM
jgi:hypothetical protein